MSDIDPVVWEANVAFEQQVVDALGQVLSLQTAVMELASNHKVVADKLGVLMRSTLAGGIMTDASVELLLPTAAVHRGEAGSTDSNEPPPQPPLTSSITCFLEPTKIGMLSPPPAPPGAVMSTKSEQPALPPFLSESDVETDTGSNTDRATPARGSAAAGGGGGSGSHRVRNLSGSFFGATVSSFHLSEPSISNKDMRQRGRQQQQQLRGHAVFESLSNQANLEAAVHTASNGFVKATANSTYEENVAPSAARAPWALHPHSSHMNLWEGLGGFALLIDSFAAPWFLAFYRKTPEVDMDRLIYWACVAAQIYWTMDIVVNSIKGYWTRDTVLELRIGAAFRRYLRSWCICDIVLVASSWIFLSAVRPYASDESPPVWSLPTSSYLYKALLLSVWLTAFTNVRKLVRVYEHIQVYLLRRNSDMHYILCLVLDSFGLLCAIFNLNHVLSCLWYAIGELDTDTGSSWLGDPIDQGWSRQYTYATSVHWSITQMTPGSMEVVPRSTIERSYAVAVVMMGWLVATALAGLVNSKMTGERLRIEEKTQRFMLLQRFFFQENVEHSLAMTANMQVKARRQERLRVRLDDVEDLHLISKATREQLSVYIFGHKLRLNSFFGLVDIFDPGAFAVLCSQAVSFLTYCPAKAVFEEGAAGDRIIFVHCGRLKYMAGVDACEHEWDKADPRLVLEDGSWCSEAALWCQWTYLGTMQAVEQSDCTSISAADLCKHVRKFKDVASMISEFSRSFLWVQRISDAKWSDLTLYIDHADVIAAMSHQARVLVGSTLLAPRHNLNRGWLNFSSGIGEKKVQKLHEEIRSGKGFVCLHNGEVVRSVFLVTLRVSRSIDKKILVKLGQLVLSTRVVKAGAVLPGTKRRGDETSGVAARRLVHKDLEKLSKKLQVNFKEPDLNASIERSAYYGIRTRYLRTIYTAWVRFDESFPSKPFDFKQQQQQQKTTSLTTGASFRSARSGSMLNLGKVARNNAKPRGVNPMVVRATSSSFYAEEILCSISELTILTSSQGGDRYDVYAWLSERDFETLRKFPDEVKNFLEVVWETEDWTSCQSGGSDWIEEV